MTKAATKEAESPLRDVRGQAVEATLAAPALTGDPNNRNGSMRRPPGLPEGCPVQALGYKGDVYYFMTADRGFKAIRDKDFTKNKIMSLYCGRIDYIETTWPRIGAKGAITGFEGDACYADHMAECHRVGPWDPASRMREGGGWREPDGTLVLHCGTQLVAKNLAGGEAVREAGRYGDFVYAKGEAQPRPWLERVQPKAMKPLLDAFQTFTWKRGELDALLLLGWCVAGVLGGALKWRPLVWITGDKGTGKSTLHEVIEHLFGGALVHASDTSAAGIYQALKFSSRPVAIDEMEAQEDNRRAQLVIQLARQASSGGLVLRGGQDHAGVEFIARSCFLFSSINHPPLLQQDLSRLAILDLDAWQGTAHGLDADALHLLGRKLRRRILDAWPKWQERLELWRNGLKRAGHSDRTADQFGTLLAGADLAMNDRVPHADNVDEAVTKHGLAHLAEQSDDLPDWQKMLDHMLTTPLDFMRGGRKVNAAQLLELRLGRVTSGVQDQANVEADAERDLAAVGLKAVHVRGDSAYGKGTWWLAIANNHQGLARLFETPTRSHWAGRSGTVGVWVQAARRVPGASWDTPPLRFNGVSVRVTLVPMQCALPEEAIAEPAP
jgi:hypothetical protein